MADLFSVNSRSLAQHWVFYDRLKEDPNPLHQKLHESILGKMNSATAEADRVRSSSKFIKAQADRERSKEIALIKTYFNIDVSANWGRGAGSTQEFIDVFNSCLNLKDVYERNKQLIINSSQKGVYTWFGTYLENTIEQEWDKAKVNFRVDTSDNLITDIRQWLESVVPKAIKNMLSADVENLSIDPNLRNAYQELLTVIGEVRQSGSYAQQMAAIYDLDRVSKELTDILMSDRELQSLTSLKANVHSRGGLALEAMYDAIMESIVPRQHGTVGGFGARVDNIATFDIDFSVIQNALDKAISHGRLDNIDIFNRIEQNLKGVHQGFIVYTSDKNYSLNSGFTGRGGYSVGEDMKLSTYEEVMMRAGQNASTFVGAILQLANGAVGESEDKQAYEDVIARNIAYLLFDDFNAIGAGLTNGVNTLHIMNLNGILVPLSTILYALADAIDRKIAIEPSMVVRVHIQNQPILFPTQSQQNDFERDNGSGVAWHYQREDALEKTMITTHFMAGLKDLLAGAMLR